MDATPNAHPIDDPTEISPRLSGTRWFLPAVIVGLAALAVLSVCLARLPPGLQRGVWVAPGEPDRLVLEFRDTWGLVAGTVYQFRDGRRRLEWGFAGNRRGIEELDLHWGRNVTLKGSVDLRQGTLEARITLPDNTVRDTTFRRMAKRDVPGYFALSELPYRLRGPEPGSGFEVSPPAKVGIDPRNLERTVRAVARGDAGLIHSLILLRHGRLVLEEYFHGYGREDLHEIQSATKSVASLLVGIAIDQGRIEGVDVPVIDFFPGLEDRGSGWERVTLRHLLTMSAGLDWSRRETRSAYGTGPELFRKVLSRRVKTEPGTRWRYVGADVNLLAGVLRQSTGMHADRFAARYLFEPLGIDHWNWEVGKTDGYPALAGTLELRPLDMARLGQLVLDEGRWDGQQIVSAEWIRESTSPVMSVETGPSAYGYLWWRDSVPLGDTSQPLILASGMGSQFIHVAPGLDAVLVTTGGNHLNRKTFALGSVLGRRLLPGVELDGS